MNSKAREALEEIVDMGTCYFPDLTLPKDDDELRDAIIEKVIDYTSLRDDFISAVVIARTALAEPLRNCDVGTPKEQEMRRMRFCRNHSCKVCPLRDVDNNGVSCDIAWAQMPYKKEGEE